MEVKPPSIERFNWKPRSRTPKSISESGTWFIDGKTSTVPDIRDMQWRIPKDDVVMREIPPEPKVVVKAITAPVVVEQSEEQQEAHDIPEVNIALTMDDVSAGFTLQHSHMCLVQ